MEESSTPYESFGVIDLNLQGELQRSRTTGNKVNTNVMKHTIQYKNVNKI